MELIFVCDLEFCYFAAMHSLALTVFLLESLGFFTCKIISANRDATKFSDLILCIYSPLVTMFQSYFFLFVQHIMYIHALECLLYLSFNI